MTEQRAHRVCIRLDPAMLLENLLLERLCVIPKARRQEWLRSLLVAGYLSEGRVARTATLSERQGRAIEPCERKEPVVQSLFSNWLSRPSPLRSRKEVDPIVPVPESIEVEIEPVGVTASTADKPFAHLRKVIG